MKDGILNNRMEHTPFSVNFTPVPSENQHINQAERYQKMSVYMK